jgi:hypothetical protein
MRYEVEWFVKLKKMVRLLLKGLKAYVIVLNSDGICAAEVHPTWKKMDSAVLCRSSVISIGM